VPPAEKRSRRIFTAAEKLRILQKADACERGRLGEVLRRDGVYSYGNITNDTAATITADTSNRMGLLVRTNGVAAPRIEGRP
jgi:hypothetical protein